MPKKIAPGYAAAAISGLLLTASYAPYSHGVLAWLALIPLFYAAIRSAGALQAARRGLAAGLVFYTLSLSWMPHVVAWLAVVFWFVFSFWLALHAGLIRALWDLAEKEKPTWERALLWTAAAGLSWAGLEYFRSELWTLACPWLGLGYSQVRNPAIFQSLSVWGVYGLSAFMAAFAAAWALVPARRVYLPAGVLLAGLILLAAWGRHRLHTVRPENGKEIKVALVQAERADINKLARLSLAPEAAGADLLVWPECSVMMPAAEQPDYISLISKNLKSSKAEAVIGVCVNADPARGVKRANFTLILGRDKKLITSYNKMHPVQFVETGLPGNKKAAPVTTPLGRLGPQICYDLAFEDGTRKMTGKGAQLLVVPTLDPMEWSRLQHTQHSDMSAARAVESGLWLVRAASSGRSQVIDRLGAETATLANKKEGVLTASAWLGDGGTFYTRSGWLLAPFSFLFTLGAFALAALKRK